MNSPRTNMRPGSRRHNQLLRDQIHKPPSVAENRLEPILNTDTVIKLQSNSDGQIFELTDIANIDSRTTFVASTEEIVVASFFMVNATTISLTFNVGAPGTYQLFARNGDTVSSTSVTLEVTSGRTLLPGVSVPWKSVSPNLVVTDQAVRTATGDNNIWLWSETATIDMEPVVGDISVTATFAGRATSHSLSAYGCIGLSYNAMDHDEPDSRYNIVNFGLYVVGSRLEMRYQHANDSRNLSRRWSGRIYQTDKLEIKRTDGIVQFLVNNHVIYTVAGEFHRPLEWDCGLFRNVAFEDIVIQHERQPN